MLSRIVVLQHVTVLDAALCGTLGFGFDGARLASQNSCSGPDRRSTAMALTTLTRAELYDLVWSEPRTRLAKRFGVSDVALGKLCRRLEIPVPERGYWARLAAGQTPPKPPLPERAEASGERITLHGQQVELGAADEVLDDCQRRLAFEHVETNRIEVPAQVQRFHGVVQATRRTWRAPVPRHTRPGFEIAVSARQRKRACLIADALIRALESRNWTITLSDEDGGCEAHLFGEAIPLSIREKAARHEGWETFVGAIRERYGQEPTAGLMLCGNFGAYRETASVSDTRTKMLEERLNQFVRKMTKLAWSSRQSRLEAEARQREWQREWEEREARARRAANARRRLESLKLEARYLAEAEEIRAYVRAIRRRTGGVDASTEISEWVAWAERQADLIDPTINGRVRIDDFEVDERPWGVRSDSYFYHPR